MFRDGLRDVGCLEPRPGGDPGRARSVARPRRGGEGSAPGAALAPRRAARAALAGLPAEQLLPLLRTPAPAARRRAGPSLHPRLLPPRPGGAGRTAVLARLR